MPTILDLFKQANGNKDVTTWNGGHKNKGLIGNAMDFLKAEANPNGPRITFYKKLVTPPLIYGSETPRISLKGTVDPPRSESLKTARYNSDPLKKVPLLDLGSLLGGSANRPSDTIFTDDKSAPITRYTLPTSVGDHTALKYAVEPDVDYIVSKVPVGPNALKGVLRGDLNGMAKKAIGAGIQAAKNAIGKAVTKAITKKRAKNNLANKKGKGNSSATKEAKNGFLYGGGLTDGKGNATKGYVKNSKYLTTFAEGGMATGVIERTGDYIRADDINAQILSTPYFIDDATLTDTLKTKKIATPFIKIKPYGKEYSMVFPATVSGISESITPEWNAFKYVGSPYNTYRYNGVERTLSFEFKLYYLTEDTKIKMVSNLNSLKELAFPYNEVSSIGYSDTNADGTATTNEVALAFAPNLIELTINGLYKNIFGFITQLEFSIDDTTSWAGNANMAASYEEANSLYPTVINVSFGMTIIENHQITDGKSTKVMRYNFDGLDNYTLSMKMEGLREKDMDKISAKISALMLQGPPLVMASDMEEEPVIENDDEEVPTFKRDSSGYPTVGTPA
jgi:hypothetical protein